jgi:hypothetical protein
MSVAGSSLFVSFKVFLEMSFTMDADDASDGRCFIESNGRKVVKAIFAESTM